MRNVLVISYFYEPCNLTPSHRIRSWAEELHKFGIYPTIITRKWEKHISSYYDASYPTSEGTEVSQNDRYEVHRLPYSGNNRDRLFAKYGGGRFKLTRKILTAIELFGQNLSNYFIPYSNIYEYARKICLDRAIDCIVISGNPYIQYKFGHRLNVEFGIPWIADYRDAWTTSEINPHERSKAFRLVDYWDRIFEKKWVSSASCVTASSIPIAEGISELTGVRGYPLYNGYVASDFASIENKQKYSRFTILYVGTLYNGQQIELFLEGFKEFIRESGAKEARVLFPGLALDNTQLSRVAKYMKGFEANFEATPRIPREMILEMELRSHVLLYVAWRGFRGIVGSKIYEYLGSGSQVLIAPSDDGAVQKILEQANWGEWANSSLDVKVYLEKQYSLFTSNKVAIPENTEAVAQFSRDNQVKQLSEYIMHCVK